MTVEREEPGHRNGQKLDDIVQDADEYYNYRKEKHVQHPRWMRTLGERTIKSWLMWDPSSIQDSERMNI